MSKQNTPYEFVKIEDETALKEVTEDFKRANPLRTKHGYALAEQGILIKPLHRYYNKVPSYEEVRMVATTIFDNTLEGTCEEFESESVFFTDSRQMTIDDIVARMIIVDVFDKSILGAQDLKGFKEINDDLKDRVRSGRDNHAVKIQSLIDSPEIEVKIPGAGTTRIKRCPFCGGYDIRLPLKQTLFVEDGHPYPHARAFIKCTCGFGFSSDYFFSERRGVWKYKHIMRFLVDKWNTRAD